MVICVQGSAHECGLFHAGQLVHAIDGNEIRELSMEEVVALLKGQAGSKVSVSVSSHLKRTSSSVPLSFTKEAQDDIVQKFKQVLLKKDLEVMIFFFGPRLCTINIGHVFLDHLTRSPA